MTRIQIFEPGLCCGTGICGVDVDQKLVTVSADIDWVRTMGSDVTRFNLAQEPLAFAENALARAFLHTVGQEGLPVVLVDGATVLTGRYPTRAELARWAGIEQAEGSPRLLPLTTTTTAKQDESACCSGPGCC
jgi:arsenite-transporting ATPase